MAHQPIPCHLTVMVMVTNQQNQVLTLERSRSWPGVTFPGGHVESGESILDCARREILEETGIRIRDLKLTGLIHWINRDDGQRYLVHCLRASFAGGELHASPEGPAAWLPLPELAAAPLSPGFAAQLPLFTDDAVIEAHGTFGRTGDSDLTFDGGR